MLGYSRLMVTFTTQWIPLWTHWDRDKIVAIYQTTVYEFGLRFHWKFLPKFRINNILALVQIMVWRRPGDKPLSEPMMVSFLRWYASLGINELNAFSWFISHMDELLDGCWMLIYIYRVLHERLVWCIFHRAVKYFSHILVTLFWTLNNSMIWNTSDVKVMKMRT